MGIVAEPKEDFGGEFRGVRLVHTDHTNKAPEVFVDLRGLKRENHPVSCGLRTRSLRSYGDAAFPRDDPRPD
jgi:hypothetical protein